MKRIIRIAVAVVIVAVFAGTFVYLYQKSKKTPTLYETENAEYANISRTTVLNGNIEPRDKVEIKPQINGIIAEIYKHAGDVVHTGDIIAKVKVIPGMEELNSADDRVRVARINLEQAKRDYDRAKKLYADKLISTEEFEKAQQDLKKAKEEIKDSIEAYLSKDEFGEYRIPAIRQRPILLMGPPGIGKTQIMEQIARECGIALVSYTITHHTRQSAVGLPFIVKKNYGEEEFSVTEYTMSEIISSVYDKMEKTGLKEGILFIDEINCVSETLAPMMLQFLQGKTFGNQKVPEGWVIVTAGNPPEYNKSVREFDVVTLDRIKKIDVEADFDVWKEYAYQQGIHPAVISYLELRRKNFYRVENTVDGKIFATARGWEDLSRLIQVYEILGKTVDREVVSQYIQHKMIAKDFASYLALYYKYRTDYKVEDILKGKWDSITLGKIHTASLDEHLSIVSLLNGKLGELFTECCLTDAYLTKLYDYMVYFRENQDGLTAKNLLEKAEADLEKDKKSELLTKQQERIQKRVVSFFENASGSKSTSGSIGSESTGSDKTGSGSELAGGGSAAAESEVPSSNRNYEFVKALFESETEAYENRTDEISFTLQNVFDFMEAAFGDSQEMVAFITELNANYYSLWFIRENGSDQYYRHNKGLLFDDRQKMLLGQMEEVENILNNGIK